MNDWYLGPVCHPVCLLTPLLPLSSLYYSFSVFILCLKLCLRSPRLICLQPRFWGSKSLCFLLPKNFHICPDTWFGFRTTELNPAVKSSKTPELSVWYSWDLWWLRAILGLDWFSGTQVPDSPKSRLTQLVLLRDWGRLNQPENSKEGAHCFDHESCLRMYYFFHGIFVSLSSNGFEFCFKYFPKAFKYWSTLLYMPSLC